MMCGRVTHTGHWGAVSQVDGFRVHQITPTFKQAGHVRYSRWSQVNSSVLICLFCRYSCAVNVKAEEITVCV